MSTPAMIPAPRPLGAAINGSGNQMLSGFALAINAGVTGQLLLVPRIKQAPACETLPRINQAASFRQSRSC
jgi:hypothetical protein